MPLLHNIATGERSVLGSFHDHISILCFNQKQLQEQILDMAIVAMNNVMWIQNIGGGGG